MSKYIGLKDKNGVEINETDRVLIYYYVVDKTNDNKQVWTEKYLIVKWCHDDIHYGYYGVSLDGDDYYNLNDYSDKTAIKNDYKEVD